MTTETLSPPTIRELPYREGPENLEAYVTPFVNEVAAYQKELFDPRTARGHNFHELMARDGEPVPTLPVQWRQEHGTGVKRVFITDLTGLESKAYKEHGAAAFFADTAARGECPPVVTANSAGNHGAGVAVVARRFNHLLSVGKLVTDTGERLIGEAVRAVVHTAHYASRIKKDSIRGFGAEVRDEHPSLEAAGEAARHQAAQEGGVHIPPFDDTRVMAGQGKVMLDVLNYLSEQGVNLHSGNVEIAVPMGGGGLAAGCAILLDQLQQEGLVGLSVKLVAVQVENKESNGFVDGTFTKTGEKTGPILKYFEKKGLVSFATVGQEAVAHAMHKLSGVIRGNGPEPAGAVASAYAMEDLSASQPLDNTVRVVIVSGGNADSEKIRKAAELRTKKHVNLGQLALSFFGHLQAGRAYM